MLLSATTFLFCAFLSVYFLLVHFTPHLIPTISISHSAGEGVWNDITKSLLKAEVDIKPGLSVFSTINCIDLKKGKKQFLFKH